MVTARPWQIRPSCITFARAVACLFVLSYILRLDRLHATRVRLLGEEILHQLFDCGCVALDVRLVQRLGVEALTVTDALQVVLRARFLFVEGDALVLNILFSFNSDIIDEVVVASLFRHYIIFESS